MFPAQVLSNNALADLHGEPTVHNALRLMLPGTSRHYLPEA